MIISSSDIVDGRTQFEAKAGAFRLGMRRWALVDGKHYYLFTVVHVEPALGRSKKPLKTRSVFTVELGPRLFEQRLIYDSEGGVAYE